MNRAVAVEELKRVYAVLHADLELGDMKRTIFDFDFAFAFAFAAAPQADC